jgi:ADP-ribose pyrophosphatase
MNIERPEPIQPVPDHAKRVFSGVLFDVYQWEQKLYDGSTTTFECLKRRDCVLVFGILPDGSILLTEQEQPGRSYFIAGAGGQIDDGESPLHAVQRELREETGYEASEYILWKTEQPLSKVDWTIYTFIAKGLKQVSEMDLDGGEKISLLPVPFEKFLDMALNPHFAESGIVPTLLEAKLYPEKMKALKELFSL